MEPGRENLGHQKQKPLNLSVISINKGEMRQMLYRTLLKLIERGLTEGIAEKIDIFFAASKLTEEEYFDLTGRLELVA